MIFQLVLMISKVRLDDSIRDDSIRKPLYGLWLIETPDYYDDK